MLILPFKVKNNLLTQPVPIYMFKIHLFVKSMVAYQEKLPVYIVKVEA